MLVTLFTDASFNKALGRGVWASWAKANGNAIRYSGAIKDKVPDIAEAELAAIANGLFTVMKKFKPEQSSRIIVTTDSMEAIASLRQRSHPRIGCRMLTNYVWAIAREQEWTLD